MKKLLFCICFIVSIIANAKSYRFIVENPSGFDRKDQPVVLDASNFGGSLPQGFPVALISGKQIPVQADDLDKNGINEELAVLLDLKAHQKVVLNLRFSAKEVKTAFQKRLNVQMFKKEGDKIIPIKEASSPTGDLYNSLHHHGPAFESELMAYRLYFDKKQTIDVYGKKQPRLELAESLWYPTDEQLARNFGDDILLVKDYVSVGTFKGWNGSKATHIEPVTNRTAKILAEGPVRTVVDMVSENWNYNGITVQLTNRVILYAGHRDLEIVNYLSSPNLDSLVFCTGVQKFPEMTSYEKDNVLAVWGRNWPVNDTVKYEKETVGLAVYCPKEIVTRKVEDKYNFLYLLKGSPVIRYYATVYWKKEAGGVRFADEFFEKLPSWRQSIAEPTRITKK
jgi:hypothetical protein